MSMSIPVTYLLGVSPFDLKSGHQSIEKNIFHFFSNIAKERIRKFDYDFLKIILVYIAGALLHKGADILGCYSAVKPPSLQLKYCC
jgi:hypothetical protein